MNLPRKLIPGSGEPFKARVVETINALIDALAASTLRPGPGILIRESPSGSVIEAAPRTASASAGLGGAEVKRDLLDYTINQLWRVGDGIYLDPKTGRCDVEDVVVYIDGQYYTTSATFDLSTEDTFGCICVEVSYTQGTGFSGLPSLVIAPPAMNRFPIASFARSYYWGPNTYEVWPSLAPAVFISPDKLNLPNNNNNN